MSAPAFERETASTTETKRSPAIYTLDLGKRYGRVTALDGISMTVERGEIFGFLGPNGAGKTTAVKLLVGLAQPSWGEAFVLGELAGHRETRRLFGYLPELFRYQDWMTAREVLTFHCKLAEIPRSRHRQETDTALEVVGLAERSNDRVGTFSKGMQQRLGLAVSLLGKPELVFLDEPTSALDPVGRYEVRQIIRDLKLLGTTVFLNSHLLNEVEQVCDRVAIVDAGKVIATGTLDDLRGEEDRVTLRLGNVTEAVKAELSRSGRVEFGEHEFVVRGVEGSSIPDLVNRLVQAGAEVYSVEPARTSLEDRFLQLLGESPDDHSDHRASHSA